VTTLHTRLAVAATLLALVPLGVSAQKPDGESNRRNLKAGAVFVMTNQVENAIAAYRRANDGTLTLVGTFPTGGAGDPVAQGADPPTDPLASQGALIMSGYRSL
jgi:hypothetical protein